MQLIFRKKFLFLVCIFLFFICIGTFYISNKSLIFESSLASVMAIGIEKSNLFNYIFIKDLNISYFSSIIGALFFNIIFPFLKNPTILQLNNLFCTSYMLMPFCLVILNFLLAKRTKRFDIAIITLFIYAICVAPCLIGNSEGIQISFLIWPMLLQYFLTEEKIEKLDKIFIGLLLLYSFKSFDLFLYVGHFLYIFAFLFYTKENVKNKKIKLVIGICSLISALFIMNKIGLDLYYKNKFLLTPDTYFYSTKSILSNLLELPIFISFIGILLSFTVAKNNKIANKDFLIFAASILVCISFNISNNYFKEIFYNPFLFVIPVIIFLIILIFEYKEIKIKNQKIYFYNLFVLSMILCCLNFIFQIKTNMEYFKYYSEIKSLLKMQTYKKIYMPKRLAEHYFKFDSCRDLTLKSLILQEKEVNTILLQRKDFLNTDEKSSNSLFYDAQNDKLTMGEKTFNVKTKYWDFSNVKNSLPKKENKDDKKYNNL